MLKKHLLTGAVLDVQEGMILFGEEVKASYQKAWSQWNQKQNVYRAVGVSLEEQEAFLLGKQQAEELFARAGKETFVGVSFGKEEKDAVPLFSHSSGFGSVGLAFSEKEI